MKSGQSIKSDGFNEYLQAVLDQEPEWNYILGVTEGDLAAAHLISPSPVVGNIVIPVVWNYLDSICAIGNGIKLILDEDDYRQTQNKIKGVLNILSGTQLFLLSYNPALTAALHLSGATTFAAPAFALAMAIDLINATIDYCNALKEVNFEGWLEERLKEVDYVENKINQLRKTMGDEANKLTDELDRDEYSFNRKEKAIIASKEKNVKLQNRLIELESRKKMLLDDIGSRCRVYSNQPTTEHEQQERKDMIDKKCACYLEKGTFLTKAMQDNFKVPASGDDILTDHKIQTALESKYNDAKTTLAFKSLSFVGMALLAISPFVSAACPPVGMGLFVAGMAITTFVSAYYLYKNAPKIINTAKNAVCKIKNAANHLFFNRDDKIKPLVQTRESALALNY